MIEKRILELRDFVQQRQCRKYRTNINEDLREKLKQYPYEKKSAMLLKFMCETETPKIFADERISFMRSISNIPAYYDEKAVKKELGVDSGIVFQRFNNVAPDYSILLNEGLLSRLNKAQELKNNTNDKNEIIFLESVIISIEAVLGLAQRYSKAADELGNKEIAALFERVPRLPAASFHEALQSIRFVHSMFYLIDHTHIGLARMDQYLYPFYQKDIETHKLDRLQAYNLLAEFFVSLNKDSDLYSGIQQGDNGQSVMLGGCKSDGSSAVNELTYIFMEVSRDLKLIDPKINLRIDSNTPDDLLELGCELTKVGLGFPQYSNDEVVIPALVKLGYSLEDARNYTVAACWEFIIPGQGCEVVNQGAVSFPAAVDEAFKSAIKSPFGFSIDKVRKNAKKSIKKQIDDILKKRDIRLLPSPFASVFFDGVLEKKQDVVFCAKYRNIGLHGSGSSNAADALAAIKVIYEKSGKAGLKELYAAKEFNFAGYGNLQYSLTNDFPKLGNANPIVDDELKFLFNAFADCAQEFDTKKRKIRPGSGSAMFYIWLTDKHNSSWLVEPIVGATADGRKEGQPFSTSLAPSHGVKINGVVSVFKSYSNIDYSRIVNGGPVTIELSPSVFDSKEGIPKLAQLIKYFVKLANQQLQLNVLDASVLEDAMAHPELHRNLIVRVWGWSGYFCELAPEYQRHVLSRHKYNLAA